ncbi:MAG: hypothetical protein ACK2UO_10270 [Caldilineaceae bacterium]
MNSTYSELGKEREQRWRRLFRDRGLMSDAAETTSSGLRVTRLELGPGRISAAVADKQLGECEVTVEMPSWRDEQWADVIDLLSRQALYAAQLLASDFPDDLESMLFQQGLSLFPADNENVYARCTCCPNASNAADGQSGQAESCIHISRTLSEAGEMLADDAWLLFLLRGRVREQVLRALRRKRGQNGDGLGPSGYGNTLQSSARDDFSRLGHGEDTAPAVHLLSEELDHFWGSARVQEQFRPHIVPPVAELMLLNRLGPPAFSHANAEVFDTLVNVYRKVTQSALALAYAEDAPEDAEEPFDDGAPDPDTERR